MSLRLSKKATKNDTTISTTKRQSMTMSVCLSQPWSKSTKATLYGVTIATYSKILESLI